MAVLTLSDFKTYLGIESSMEDTKLTLLVDATNEFIKNYCHRIFEATDYDELYDGTGTNSLILNNYPIISITSIYASDEEVEERTGIDEEGYYIKDAEHGVIYNNDLWERGRGIIKVTYRGGYETIPGDLIFAYYRTAEYLRHIYGRTGIVAESLGAYSFNLAQDVGSAQGMLSIPDLMVKSILDRYRQSYIQMSY